jgi:cell wall hydrolase
MRRSHHRSSAASPRVWLLATLIALLAASFVVAVVPALADDGSASPAAVVGDSASPSPAPSPTIAWTLTPAKVVYGKPVVAAGTVSPAVAGQTVDVAIGGTTVTSATTDAAGAFSVSFVPATGGTVTATVTADGTTGAALALSVLPKVALSAGSSAPWGSGRLVVKVAPAAYSGAITVTVFHHGRRIARLHGHVAAGKAVFSVRTPGVGSFPVQVKLEAADGLAVPPIAKATVKAPWHRLVIGSRGSYVKILLSRLVALKFRVPGISTSLSVEAGDSVVAFQKAYRLPRTYVFDGDDWTKLDSAHVIKVRHTSPQTHIEIDKTRQILMVVKNGAPYGIIPISSGATGNTPVGTFHILRKAPSTTTWLGSAILWRTMDFYGNFAIHGYPEVPPYPASHGCVREPIWVADWTYTHSWVGETIYIYYLGS